MNEEPYLKRTQSGAVVTLTLDRGERFNPLSMGVNQVCIARKIL